MEMDSSRRPFDRSREPGLKKPRLAAEERNPRPYPVRPIGSGGPNQIPSRFEREAEGNDPSGGGGYQPQPLPQHQQNLELIEQYRTALSELTFNSKPIITNLTIIAGENLHAAKPIASTICAHILEVPSDQKLPSLYLLDSIVKNIGRDYIKYFAARLPEVFCKAYRQVDPPVNSSMRHLFGTWKGVFPLQMLQIIEKELGFVSSSNGSSAPATSRPESQSPRPPHSIHVNPKYLERQRLQQSARPKLITSEEDGALIIPSEDIERLDRPTGVTTGRTWAAPPAKVQRSQRDPRIDLLQDKNNVGVGYGDFEYGPEVSRNSVLGPGRSGSKVIEQKPQYGVSSSGVADTFSTQRNGLPARQKPQNYPSPSPSNIDSQLSRRVGGISTSWKNSEEEEFSWESMDSRSTDYDANIARKDHWASEGSEKLEFENKIGRTLSREGRNQVGTLGTPSHSVTGLTTSGSSLPRTGIGSQVRSSPYIGSPSLGISASSSGTIRQQRIQPRGSPSPSAQSPMHHHSPPADVAQHPQISGKSSLSLSNRYVDNSLPVTSDTEMGSLKRKLQPQESKASAPSPAISLQQSRKLPQISQPISASTSSLLAAIARSGSIPVTSLPGLGSLDKVLDASEASSKALPSGPLASTILGTFPNTSSVAKGAPIGKISKSEPEVSPNATKSSDPISSLLSSLVAKGLISAAKTEPPAPVASKTTKPLPNIKQEANAATPEPVSPASLLSVKKEANPATPEPDSSASVAVKIPDSEPVAEKSDLPQPPVKEEDIKNLIGFDFKPEVMRKFYTAVVDDLFIELPHQCGICGLRLKLKERLDRHLVWHASQNPEQRTIVNASSKWYRHSSDWVAGITGPPNYEDESIKFEERCSKTISEPMIPADESQCACVLCGDLFEDFYNLEKDEWMFKGAVYMTIPCKTPTAGDERDSNIHGPIVHSKCLSENSLQDLGLDINIKMEEDG